MDYLKSPQTKDYNSLSRYATTTFYYHIKDKKYIYGLTKQLSTTTDYVAHIVKPEDTLESIALFYYGRPDYYWIIADYNRINPFIHLSDKYTTIRVPSISYIYYEDNLYGKQ